MSGDLRAVLAEVRLPLGTGTLRGPGVARDIVAALAAATEPLTATVEWNACPTCGSTMRNGYGWVPDPHHPVGGHFCDDEGPADSWHGTGTVRIVAMTEDVLRARLREVPEFLPAGLRGWAVDAIVRALFGEAGDD